MATEITVSAGYIPNFALDGYTPAAGDTVSLLWQLTEDGLDDDGVPRLRGTGPTIACTVYAWDSVDSRFEDAGGVAMPSFSPALSQYDGPYALYIPSFQIDPTADWLRPRPGRYSVKFRTPDLTERRWRDWQDIVIPIDPNPIRLIDISLYSKGGVSGWGFDEAYTKEEVDAKITAALGASITNPMTAVGDLIYGSTIVLGLATPTRLAATTNGFFLKLAAGLPAWAALTSGEITTALGYTPENAALKNAASGYAGLSAGSKITASQMTEVLGLPDLTDVAPGAVPTLNHFLVGNGTAWSNSALGSSHVTTALGYTPENAANRNAAGGYAGLTAGKITASQIQEVIGLADLSDVTASGPSLGQFVSWNGSSAYVLTGGTPNGSPSTNLLGALLFHDATPTADLAYATSDYPTDPRDSWYWLQFMPGPNKIGLATRGSYSDSTAGANFQLASYVQNTGTRNTVAAAFMAIQKAAGTVWAINPIAFTDVDGVVVATAIANEVNFGSLGTSTAALAYGEAIYSVANASTVKGTARAYIQLAVSDVDDGFQANAKARDGISFIATGTTSPVLWTTSYGGSDADSTLSGGGLGAFFAINGVSANFAFAAVNSQFGYGIDFAGSTFNNAQFRMAGRLVAAGAGEARGVAVGNAENSTSLNALEHYYSGAGANSDGNEIWIGDYQTQGSAGSGINQIRFHTERDSAGTTDSGANRAVVSRYGLGGIHLLGWHASSTVPTLVTGAFTGGGTENPSINSTSIVGRDPAHIISFSTQTAPAANAKIYAVTFVEAYPSAPAVVLTPETGGVAESELHVRNRATTGYEVWSGATALTAATAYVVSAVVIGYQ